jgi:AraC-like DNA-binding protein
VNICTDWQADIHSHSWTEIMFVTEGSGRILMGSSMHPMNKDDLIIINPGTTHYEEFHKQHSANSRLCFFSCCVEDFETSMLPPNHLLPAHYPSIFKTGEMAEKFLSAFTETFEECEAGKEWYADICKNLSYEIVMLTLRLLHEKYDLALQWQNDRNVDLVRQFIDQHFTEKINSDMIAKELAMSRQTLYRLFQKGVSSPAQYVIQKRIEFAKRLILETGDSLQDIAYKTGYSDYSSFFTVFKKNVGVAPNEFRQFHGTRVAASN